MQSGVILLSEVLYRIDKGERFSIEFVKCDRKRGTGGGIKQLTHCIKNSAAKPSTPKTIEVTTTPTDMVLRPPRHFENSTRNVYCLHDRKMIKVHLRLITRFNGQRVL